MRRKLPTAIVYFIRLLFAASWLVWFAPAYARDSGAAVTPLASAIASAHPLATRAGYEILDAGGNAFDAAVAVSAALAVVEPYSSGIGGGGFWLVHRAKDGFQTMIDGRETAPLLANSRMYVDGENRPVPKASLEGARAAAIPGTPAALAWLSKRYGMLPLKTSLAPAIRLANEGFPVDERYRAMAEQVLALLRASPASARLFLAQNDVPAKGYNLRQPELAATLAALARAGADGFYKGAVARELIAASDAGGGIWQLQDLTNYRVIERKPVTFTFLDHITVTSAALPSSGGVTLAQGLNILEFTPYLGSASGKRTHYVAEAMRRAFQDRNRYLGDPDFVTPPIEQLIDKNYAARRALSIDPNLATTSASLERPAAKKEEGGNTTHFSIIDRAGNRVAATLSINTAFGSGFVAGKTGVLLNNEMDDFAVSPGAANAYGLVQGEANEIKPGKRPLSSMSPTFVEDERGVLIVGSPGGSRIISMVLLAILGYATDGVPDPQRLVSAPRFHHQFLPDRIEVEPEGFSSEFTAELQVLGHKVEAAKRKWGNMQAVFFDKRSREIKAASDPRGIGGLP